MYPFMADWKRTPYSPGLGSPPSGPAGTELGNHMLHGQFCAREDAAKMTKDRTAREQIEGNILRISDSLNTTWGVPEEDWWTCWIGRRGTVRGSQEPTTAMVSAGANTVLSEDS